MIYFHILAWLFAIGCTVGFIVFWVWAHRDICETTLGGIVLSILMVTIGVPLLALTIVPPIAMTNPAYESTTVYFDE